MIRRLIPSTLILSALEAIPTAQPFTPSRSDPKITQLFYQTFSPSQQPQLQHSPAWVPMELIELAAEDSDMALEEFVTTFADAEAYTSCDDEGDDLHECDFFGQYLGPTKWLHLTPQAHKCVDQVHFTIWKDVWSHPHGMVDVADKVSKETLRHYSEFMLSKGTASSCMSSSKPLIRVKVIPASFGLEAFEDAIWEAAQDLIPRSSIVATTDTAPAISKKSTCKAITFVVASPDLSDPILREKNGGCSKSSSQAEFASDTFQSFASTLHEKLKMFSRMEEVALDDLIEVRAFHPLWKEDTVKSFPYPCVAISAEVQMEEEEDEAILP
ncbi:hypothetical protein HJC23_013208 [Cyclotella cryptica]|uniref:Uncharacterized protein n=1 Tax=Cyclotella cryptica TaxID=29204 RepID=A0ABD3QJ16_9STRA|eukprot:CCRYP_006646-RA/>CCRYP_006646-RA protein AED:0.07 eAED:0.07 QI:309/1/1/1/0.5/0.66/3/204/326